MIEFVIPGDTIWKDIKGYEGLYMVSAAGDVKSIKRSGTKGGVLIGNIAKGYKRVLLKKNNKAKKFFVHRLVADVFLDKQKDKNFVNHIDGNKLNNHVNNLEWCNRSENQLHAYKLGLQKVDVTKAHAVRHEKTKRKIIQLSMSGEEIKIFNSIREAAKSLGMNDGTHISAAAKGKRKSCGGFRWKYIS
ncbi:NUMOD4 domain-containing protein [Virgibacillus sp. FSP13]